MINRAEKVKYWQGIAKNEAKYYIRHKAERYADVSVADYFKPKMNWNRERLIKQFGYTDEDIDYCLNEYNTAFWRGYEWWQKQNAKNEAVLKEYEPIFKEAEAVAKAVDVSDIKDGFPCGGGVLYLDRAEWDSKLGKAIKQMSDYNDRDVYSYKLPVKLPSYGQCVSFDERVYKKTAEFLTKQGIPASVYIYID